MAAKNELLYLVLQLLKEEGLTDAAHALEQSSGIYFDTKHFEELVIAGSWEPAEKYLLGFTGWEANGSSLKMFFELRKQKYLEALDRYAADVQKALGSCTFDVPLRVLRATCTYLHASRCPECCARAGGTTRRR
jgi:hypothetical protein